jgi:F0F1-type ATP synthase membrane subunit b/b'
MEVLVKSLLIGSLAAFIIGVGLIAFKDKRKAGQGTALVAFVVLVLSVVWIVIEGENKATKEGFQSASDQRAARQANANPQEWAAHKARAEQQAAEERQQAAEERRRAEQQAAEERRHAEQQAAEERRRQQEQKWQAAAQRERELRAKARQISYDSLAREPLAYKGQTVVFRGQVTQVQESGLSVILRVNVTRGQFIWKDTVWVEYRKKVPDERRILDDDILTFWGEYKGIMSYKAVFGQTIQIPHVVADIVENAGKPRTDR